MKTNCCRGILVLVVTVTLFLQCGGLADANTFCVSTAVDLQSALNTAASNGEHDLIQIVQGTYSGSFLYNSGEPYDLTIEGGYNENCTLREVNLRDTILDGGLPSRQY